MKEKQKNFVVIIRSMAQIIHVKNWLTVVIEMLKMEMSMFFGRQVTEPNSGRKNRTLAQCFPGWLCIETSDLILAAEGYADQKRHISFTDKLSCCERLLGVGQFLADTPFHIDI